MSDEITLAEGHITSKNYHGPAKLTMSRESYCADLFVEIVIFNFIIHFFVI